jgi:hypothetical protein
MVRIKTFKCWEKIHVYIPSRNPTPCIAILLTLGLIVSAERNPFLALKSSSVKDLYTTFPRRAYCKGGPRQRATFSTFEFKVLLFQRPE